MTNVVRQMPASAAVVVAAVATSGQVVLEVVRSYLRQGTLAEEWMRKA